MAAEGDKNPALLILMPSESKGGAEQGAIVIGDHALRRGWHVEFAFPEIESTRPMVAEVTRMGAHHIALDIGDRDVRGSKLIFHLNAFFRTLKILLRYKPDLVQIGLPWPNRGFGSILACAALNVPAQVVFHSAPEFIEMDARKARLSRWARKRNQRWVAVSEHNREVIARIFSIDKDCITTIYNGIDFKHFARVAAARSNLWPKYAEELRASEENFLVLTAARLSKEKGHSDIVQAAPRVIEECPQVIFLFAGDGDERSHLEQEVRRLGLETNFRFLGQRKDIAELLAVSDIFLLPTYMEGFAFSLLEAMAAGKAIVASNVCSNPEVIRHGETGLLIEPGQPAQIAEALTRLVGNPGERARLGKGASALAGEFTRERMINEVFEQFEDMLRK